MIIPVYNTEQYLSRCLDSVIASDYRNLEVICIDDGSTDNSLMVLKEYAIKDDRIKVVDVPNGGVSKARNIGLAQANGEYITFVDSDDWIHKQFFSLLLWGIEKNAAGLVVCGFDRTDSYCKYESVDKGQLKMTVFNSINALDNHTVKSHVWGRMFCSNIINSHRFENGLQTAEDTLFNLDVFADNLCLKTVLIESSLYFYFNRDGSIINTCNGLDYKQFSYIYLARAENAENKSVACLYLNEAFKNTFSVRYLTRKENDKILIEEINQLILQCLAIEKDKKALSVKKEIIYKLISYFPAIYTMFRRVKER